MKLIHCLLISSLIVLNGMPLTAQAQTAPQILSLPEGRSGEPYRVQLESVLRDNYGLKLEAGKRSSIFRWGFVSGELPPGLSLRMNGTIVGTPRKPHTQPYQFQLRVIDATMTGADPLKLDFSLTINASQVKLVQVNAPRLVAIGEPVSGRKSIKPDNSEGGDVHVAARPSEHHGTPAAEAAFTPPAHNGRMREVALSGPNMSVPPYLLTPADSPADAHSRIAGNTVSATGTMPFQSGPCVPPTPSPAPGKGVFYLDARNGNLTENGRPASPRRRFKKDERVAVVIVNKNPYLYTYKYSSTATTVVESALNTFVPFIVGKLGELGASPEKAGVPGVASSPPRTNGTEKADLTPDCTVAREKITTLATNLNTAIDNNDNIKTSLGGQKTTSDALTNAYNTARATLYSPNQTVDSLYCTSTTLVKAVNDHTGAGGVNSTTLDKIGNAVDALEREANRLISRRDIIREAHANCLNQFDTGPNPLLGDYLREVGERAAEILVNVKSYRETITKIRQDLATALEGRKGAQAVLNDPNAFFDVRNEGGYETTNDVAIKLEVTPKQGVAEAQPVQGSPFAANFTFGGAPFFSVSGGLIFSPLRKREFVRVQGFERDQQGELVLKDEKPNLTTVIGLSERSPTRITPAIFLNGRLTERWNGIIDGLHMTLGITAKNDNKGTDVEFLIGPSVSFFDGNMFLTGGGYAGRQQKLGGSLFEGFAVPADVDELPIEKSYRWNFGFSLSYRLPVNK